MSLMTTPTSQLATLAAVCRELTNAADLDQALSAVARAAAEATGSALAVIRVRDSFEQMPARGVWSASSSLEAELEGSRLSVGEIGIKELSEADELPPSVRRLAERVRAAGVVVVPAVVEDRILASLELMRARERFTTTDRMLAEIAAHHAGLLVRAFEPPPGSGNGAGSISTALDLAGRALTAGTDDARSAERIA